MEHQMRTKAFNTCLATSLLIVLVTSPQAAEAGSITATSFESKAYISGDITDQIIASRGRPTYKELGSFEDTGLYTNANALAGHNLSLKDSVKSGSFSSIANAATTATSTASPYILDLSLGTQASGSMYELNIGDTSNYYAYAYHDVRFHVDGLFSLSLDWDASVAESDGSAFSRVYLQDLTDSQYIIYRTKSNIGTVSDSLSDVALQDGHSYKLWLYSESRDLNNSGSSSGISNINVRLADLSPTSIVPSPSGMFVGVVGLVGLALRRRRRCEGASESH